jgi:hypothetical protein
MILPQQPALPAGKKGTDSKLLQATNRLDGARVRAQPLH